MNFAKALKRTMTEFDLKGVELSQKTGLSENAISAFRRGSQSMTVKNLEKILRAMPADARQFFFHELEQGDYSQDLTAV